MVATVSGSTTSRSLVSPLQPLMVVMSVCERSNLRRWTIFEKY